MPAQPALPADPQGLSRSVRLDTVLTTLLSQTPEVEAAAVVTFDGLPMASALPGTMDEDRVAAMSAALLSLGERAAEGLGRGELSQVYIEGDNGTVFLISCDDEAVLVAVAAKGAKVGMMLYEVRRAAATVGRVLQAEDEFELSAASTPADAPELAPAPEPTHAPEPSYQLAPQPTYQPTGEPVDAPRPSVTRTVPAQATRQSVSALDVPASTWSSYDPAASAPSVLGSVLPGEPPRWS